MRITRFEARWIEKGTLMFHNRHLKNTMKLKECLDRGYANEDEDSLDRGYANDEDDR